MKQTKLAVLSSHCAETFRLNAVSEISLIRNTLFSPRKELYLHSGACIL